MGAWLKCGIEKGCRLELWDFSGTKRSGKDKGSLSNFRNACWKMQLAFPRLRFCDANNSNKVDDFLSNEKRDLIDFDSLFSLRGRDFRSRCLTQLYTPLLNWSSIRVTIETRTPRQSINKVVNFTRLCCQFKGGWRIGEIKLQRKGWDENKICLKELGKYVFRQRDFNSDLIPIIFSCQSKTFWDNLKTWKIDKNDYKKYFSNTAF